MSATKLDLIKLQFCGLQEFGGTYMPLWTVVDSDFNTKRKAHFFRGSTFSERTLKDAKFFVPNPTGWQPGQIFDPSAETLKETSA